MPECDYCGAEFDGEAAYHDHLRAEHADELGPIDSRRIGADGSGREFPTGPVALGAVLVVSVGLVVYLTFLSGSGAGGGGVGDVARTPTDVGAVHYHGTIEVVIEGDPVDFTRAEYKRPREYPAFHFEGRSDPRWHVHARGVTLEYAMATLGIGVTASTVTFEGTTYRDSDPGTNVTVTVNGDPVTPSEYVLRDGDHVRIAVSVSG